MPHTEREHTLEILNLPMKLMTGSGEFPFASFFGNITSLTLVIRKYFEF